MASSITKLRLAQLKMGYSFVSGDFHPLPFASSPGAPDPSVPHSGKRFVQQRVKAGASVLGMYPPGDDALAACRKWLDSGEPGDEQGPASAEADSRAADQ